MNTKIIGSLREMSQFGINTLTGEACAFSLRTLCDLSAEGRSLLAEYFGITEDGFVANWNSFVGAAPAVASVMLAHDCLPSLAAFALFRDGATHMLVTERQYIGIYDEDTLTQYKEAYEGALSAGTVRLHTNWKVPGQPHVGSRNVHAFTGRVQ